MASFVRSVTKAERSLVRQRTEVRTEQTKAAKAARRKRLQAVQDLMSTMAEKQEGVLERNFDEDEGTDPFEQLYGPNRLLTPPYSFERLYRIYEESDILQSCVDAMQNNIDGFGYKLLFLGDDVKEKDNPEAKTQRVMLESFFNQVNERQSMTTIRKLQREDLEVVGNGAYEVIRNLRGEVSMMYFAPFRRVRISALKGRPVTVEVPIKRNGKIITVKIRKYFRKFAQLDGYGKTLRWFKEFGDPRVLDYRTGEYTDTRYKASELWHFKIPFGGMTYGLPRWIGALLQVMGRRSAHFVNYDLFENQGIPPMAIMVSGGTLTDDSLDELEALMNSAKGIEAFNRILLLESMMESTGLDEKGTAKIEMKNMTEYRREDMMFDKYLKGAKNDVRHVYRLPDLYVGQSETFTHATAKAAQTVAEEQVFIPERGDFDEQLNLQLLRGEMKVTYWKIQTRGPRVVGASDISKAVQTFSAAGAFTVNHAIEQANEAFGLEMSKYDDDWANYPIPIVIELVKAGRLTGLDKIAEAAKDTSTTINNQLPAPAEPKLLPAPTQKMLKSDLFTEDERSLYRLLVTIQSAIEQGAFNCEVDNTPEQEEAVLP